MPTFMRNIDSTLRDTYLNNDYYRVLILEINELKIENIETRDRLQIIPDNNFNAFCHRLRTLSLRFVIPDLRPDTDFEAFCDAALTLIAPAGRVACSRARGGCLARTRERGTVVPRVVLRDQAKTREITVISDGEGDCANLIRPVLTKARTIRSDFFLSVPPCSRAVRYTSNNVTVEEWKWR